MCILYTPIWNHAAVPVAQHWSTLIQDPRQLYSLTAVEGTLVVAGGYSQGKYFRSVEMLRPGDAAWTTASWSLKEEICEHCAWSGSPTELIILGGANRKAIRLSITKIKLMCLICILNQFFLAKCVLDISCKIDMTLVRGRFQSK